MADILIHAERCSIAWTSSLMLRYGVALWPFSLECFKGILACTIFQCWREIMVSSGRLVVRPWRSQDGYLLKWSGWSWIWMVLPLASRGRPGLGSASGSRSVMFSCLLGPVAVQSPDATKLTGNIPIDCRVWLLVCYMMSWQEENCTMVDGSFTLLRRLLDLSHYLQGFFSHVLRCTNSEVDTLTKSVVRCPSMVFGNRSICLIDFASSL